MQYCDKFGSDGLKELYKQYKDNGFAGLPRHQIKSPQYYDAGENAGEDEYRLLLIHIMIGLKYRDDSEFLD